MNDIYQYIIEQSISGKIVKPVAVSIIEMLKRENGNKDISDAGIAIIGMAIKSAHAKNLPDFWSNILTGVDLTRNLNRKRVRDIEDYYEFLAKRKYRQPVSFSKSCYLEEIDRFDYQYFGLSPQEARLMDPNQRLFLETAYAAIEDAGRLSTLNATNTGLYIGFASAKMNYLGMINEVDPIYSSQSLPSNLDANIASRISHYLDLKGPNMIINTACSSSLVALHLACHSIIHRDCDQAIAAGIKISLLPIYDSPKLGMENHDGITKPFDENCSGTSWGEGVAAVLLKPLDRALRDRDNIYAVIKGSAINQDGRSAGLTAPNARAQEEVIVSAWQAAGIDPSTVSYIEAHGTGTKLGDPIEIEGITQAFRRFTDRKQFCAVGSLKSNIEHTAEAAGLFGLVKAALALKHRQLPPSLHFHEPNHQIDWNSSPVYVNTGLAEWIAPAGQPRRCGVSSFGISGTNCHVVLEEAPPRPVVAAEPRPTPAASRIFTLSAKKESVLEQLVRDFCAFLDTPARPEDGLTLDNLCYTACAGREHYRYRLALIVRDLHELREKLGKIADTGLKAAGEGVCYSAHRLVPSSGKKQEKTDRTAQEKARLSGQLGAKLADCARPGKTNRQILPAIASLYVRGADADWEVLYRENAVRRISLPTYPFQKIRCWLDIPAAAPGEKREGEPAAVPVRPLLEKCLSRSIDQDIYETVFSPARHFLLRDHVIDGYCVLPGTACLEMAREAGEIYYPGRWLELKDIVFHTPAVLADGETRPIQLIVKKHGDHLEFTLASRLTAANAREEEWLKHATGEIWHMEDNQAPVVYDLARLKGECSGKVVPVDLGRKPARDGFLRFGPRWHNYRELRIGPAAALAELELPAEFAADLKDYYLHPALLDTAAAAIPLALPNGRKTIPLAYRSLRIFGPTTRKLYAYFRTFDPAGDRRDTMSYDLELLDDQGKVLAQIEGFTTKLVPDFARLVRANRPASGTLFHRVAWSKAPLPERPPSAPAPGLILFFAAPGLALKKGLEEHYRSSLVTITMGRRYQKISGNRYIIANRQSDYDRLLKDIEGNTVHKVIQAFTLGKTAAVTSWEELKRSQDKGVMSLFYLAKAIQKNQDADSVDIVLLSALARRVTGRETVLHPEAASLAGLGKALRLENPALACRAIDSDGETDSRTIIEEIGSPYSSYQVAYRRNDRYVETLAELDLAQIKNRPFAIKSDGAYIIAGGAGALGLEIADCLCRENNRVKLALLGRSPLSKEKHATIERLRQAGATVAYYQVDITEPRQLRSVLEKIRQEYGQINSLIQAAGIAGDGFIIRKDEATFRRVLAPKVLGTWLLDYYTKTDKLENFIVFSSTASLFGAPGQGDYSAANAYLDAFSEFREQNSPGSRVLSINWGAWRETGMAARAATGPGSITEPLTRQIAKAAFKEAINKDISRLAIGRLDYGHPAWRKKEKLNIVMSPEIRTGAKKQDGRQSVFEEARTTVRPKLKGKKPDENYTGTEEAIARIWQQVLGYDEIDVNSNFFEIGGDSLMMTQVHNRLKEQLSEKIGIAQLFTYPTIAALARELSVSGKPKNEASISAGRGFRTAVRPSDIAIVGIAAKTSLADTARQYWDNLAMGRDCVREIPLSRKSDIKNYYFFKKKHFDFTFQKSAYLGEIDKFDYQYFNLSPQEARLMDPNQRLFLETAYAAIEDAGTDRSKIIGSNTALFVAYAPIMSAVTSYQHMIEELDPASVAGSIPGNMKAIIPSRVSYNLNLKGPSILIDTACSSSLTAIHLACLSLKNQECENALVGSVYISLFPVKEKHTIGVESSDGLTKSFDNDSDGIGIGEGVAAVLLKPLDRALRDRDNIYAVIKGSAINQDGRSAGLTAPNARAQEEVIVSAWQAAGIDPSTVSYIEAHGTGTKLGDPIEIEGITQAFRRFTDRKQFCALSTAKSNIGHLDFASGLFGLVKAALALKYRLIPPSIRLNEPNHKISWNDAPVYLNTELKNWVTSDNTPRRCGISSFGMSGTNAHVVLEEFPSQPNSEKTNNSSPKRPGIHLLLLSAKKEEVLKQLIINFRNFLSEDFSSADDITLENICFTANTGREFYDHRLAIIVKDITELRRKIKKIAGIDPSQLMLDNVYYDYRHEAPSRKRSNDKYIIGHKAIKQLSDMADAKIKQFVSSGLADHELLKRIAGYFVEGADPDWSMLYQKQRFRKISLPTYPFQRLRCWLDIPEVSPEERREDGTATTKNQEEQQSLPSKTWLGVSPKLKGKNSEDDYSEIEGKLARIWQQVLGYGEFDIHDNFFEIGGNSLLLARVHNKLEEIYHIRINVSRLFAHPTLAGMAGYLSKLKEPAEISDRAVPYVSLPGAINDIAIIGIAARTSWANTYEEFWDMIVEKRSGIRQLPDCRRRDADKYINFIKEKYNEIVEKRYEQMAYLDEIDKFDYKYFHISPREAQLMDPNQRLFLEIVYACIEDAGMRNKFSDSKTGLYIGFQTKRDYLKIIRQTDRSLMNQSITGNDSAILAGRLSHIFNLKGPSLTIDTACSSSLVAIHLACQSIRNNECEMAIAGGANINAVPVSDYPRLGMESDDGLTRSFDETSGGTNWSEGIAAVLLKPLDKALHDRDNIHAVIKGSAVNQDGTSTNLTAPSVRAQEEVILSCWQNAGIDPETISYVEAHGTGTKLGDPVEIEALTNSFKRFTAKKQFCAISSVKSNIGHTVAAAGIFSLIKSVSALEKRQLPPSLHFYEPNHIAEWSESALYVNTYLKSWDRTGKNPRRCGVSSFGFSGTNCHIVLEEPPAMPLPITTRSRPNNKADIALFHLFVLSAKDRGTLINLVREYVDMLNNVCRKRNTHNLNIKNICYTAALGRGHYSCRLAFVVKGLEDLRKNMDKIVKLGFVSSNLNGAGTKVAFYNELADEYNSGIMNNMNMERNKNNSLNREAENEMKNYITNSVAKKSRLTRIAELYVSGADPDWNILYTGEEVAKVALPTYQFSRTRCWIDIPTVNDVNYFYETVWKEKRLEGETHEKDSGIKSGATMVLGTDLNGKPAALSEKLSSFYGASVLNVTIGSCYMCDNGNYTIRNNYEDYYRLIGEIHMKYRIMRIVHAFTYNDVKDIQSESELEQSQRVGVQSLFNLVKAILNNNIKDDIDIVLLSSLVNKVKDKEKNINASAATLFGLGKAVYLENFRYPGLRCRCIDADSKTSVSNIVKEIASSYEHYMVAYRGNTRYIEVLDKLDIGRRDDRPIEIKKNNVYIITGGMGGIGLKIAEFLANKNKIKIALLGRSDIFQREGRLIPNDNEKKKEDAIRRIESLGSEIKYYKVNVGDYRQTSQIFNQVRKEWGKINGIIHCAGVSLPGSIKNQPLDDLMNTLLPKVKGTWVLDKAAAADKLDFFILFSSAITVISGVGAGAYTAANSFLNSYAQRKGLLSINWPNWENVGMATNNRITEDRQLFKMISENTSLELFDRIYSKKINNVIVGDYNYESEILKLNYLLPFSNSTAISLEIENHKRNKRNLSDNDLFGRSSTDRPVELTGRADGKYTKTERQLAALWYQVLGYEELNINDNFFEVGGDSLLAIQLQNHIENTFDTKIGIADLFDNPTIGLQAQNVLSGGKKADRLVLSAINKDSYPLSYVQERIWTDDKINPGSNKYNIGIINNIKGNLNPEIFKKALLAVLDRHESLRTRFVESESGEIRQIIDDKAGITIKESDFSGENEKTITPKIEKITDEFINAPYDLSHDRLVRVMLIKHIKDFHIFAIAFHHILADAESIEIFFRDLYALYDSLAADGSSHLLPLPIQYKEYAEYQRGEKFGNIVDIQEKYWTKQLAGRLSPATLPCRRYKNNNLIFKINVESEILYLENKLINSLDLLAKKCRVSMYILLFAVFNALINKITGQEDILIGTFISNRNSDQFGDVMGMFVNTVILRTKVNGDDKFLDILRKTKTTVIGAMENKDFPYDLITGKLGLNKSVEDKRLFKIVFQELHKISNNKMPRIGEAARNTFFLKYDLVGNSLKDYDMNFWYEYNVVKLANGEKEKSIKLNIDYNPGLFEKSSIRNWLRQYQSLCEEIIDNPSIEQYNLGLPGKGRKTDTSVIKKTKPVTHIWK